MWNLEGSREDYERRGAEIAEIDQERAKALPPMEGKPEAHQSRPGPTYSSGKSESEEPATSEEVAGAK